MRRMKPETKRKIAGAVAITIILAMLLSLVLPFVVRADVVGDSANSSFEIEGMAGVNGFYRINSTTPVEAIITNNGSDFVGNAEIRFDLAGMDYYDDYEKSKQFAIYSYPLEIQSGETKKISMDIKIPSIVKELNIDLNKDDKIIQSVSVKVNALRLTSTLIGVLSDDFKALNYHRQMEFFDDEAYENLVLADRFLELNEKTFPESVDVLENFNFILINNYDTNKLSEKQTIALNNFVLRGGILIIGTGVYAEQTLKIVSNFLPISINGTENIYSLVNSNYIYDFELVNPMKTTILESDVNLDVKIYGNDENFTKKPLSYVHTNEEGRVIIHSFDLADAAINDNYMMVNMLNALYAEELAKTVSASGAHSKYGRGGYNLYWNANSMLSNLPNLSNSTFLVIFIIIAIYLMIIGPILYLILKKMNKREYAWFMIPALSLTALGIIFMISLDSPYSAPLLHGMTTLELPMNGTSGRAKINFAAFSPEKGMIKTKFAEDISLNFELERFNSDYAYKYDGGSLNTGSDKILCKLEYGDNPGINFYDQMSWANNLFLAEKEVTLSGGFVTELQIINDTLKGTITNETGIAFSDLIILHSNIISNVGAIEPYETITIDIPSDKEIGNDPNLICEEIFPYHNVNNSTNATSADYQYVEEVLGKEAFRLYSQKRSFLQMELEKTKATTTTTASSVLSEISTLNIYAMSEETLIDDTVTINGKKPTNIHLTMIKTKAEIHLNDEKIKLGYGTIPISEIISDANYSYYASNEIYVDANGEMRLIYRTPEGFTADLISFDGFYEDMYIRNNVNEEGEEWSMIAAGKEYTSNEFYAEDGKIELMFFVNREGYYILPMIKATISRTKEGN